MIIIQRQRHVKDAAGAERLPRVGGLCARHFLLSFRKRRRRSRTAGNLFRFADARPPTDFARGYVSRLSSSAFRRGAGTPVTEKTKKNTKIWKIEEKKKTEKRYDAPRTTAITVKIISRTVFDGLPNARIAARAQESILNIPNKRTNDCNNLVHTLHVAVALNKIYRRTYTPI